MKKQNRTSYQFYIFFLLFIEQPMQLAQKNLLQLNINEHILGINFEMIENQFKKLRKEMGSIKRTSINIIGKINQLDPFDQLDELEQSEQEKGLMEKQKEKKEKSMISRIQLARPETNQSNRDNSKESIMEMNNDIVQVCKNSKKKNKSFKKSFEGDINEIQRSAFKERKSTDFLKRVLELQNLTQEQDKRIMSLQRDGALFRRNFGMKTNKKQKTELIKVQENSPEKKNFINQSAKVSEKERSDNQSSENGENQQNQSNAVFQLSKDLNQIRDYLAGKLKSIDNQLNNTSDRLNKQFVRLNQQILEINRRFQQLKSHIDNVEQPTFLKSNSNQKSPQSSFQKARSTHQGNSHVLNETMQSYRAYYEDKIVEIFEEMDNLKKQYIQTIQKMGEDQQTNGVIAQKDQERLKNIAMRIGVTQSTKGGDETLKKQVATIKKEHKKFKQEFDNLMVGVNSGQNETRTLLIKPNETKDDWKTLSQKIHKVKQECLGAVKQLENKILANNDMIVGMNELQVGLGECKIMLNKKIDTIQNDKNMKRIQNRLNNFIRQACEKQGTTQEQDAMIVRQPWFCLSCDTQIKNYTGKPVRSTYNEKFQGKKVNPESHMIRRSDKSHLPSLH